MPSLKQVFVSLLLLAAPSAWADRDVLIELNVGFVPVANDVPIMIGAGVRFDQRHEVWARIGWFTTGDDVNHPFGVIGYREVFRPGALVRPFVGGLIADLPATCGHDAQGTPSCSAPPLYVFSANAGVRIEPCPWLGLYAALMLGIDSYPNPFGLVELGVTFFLPFSR